MIIKAPVISQIDDKSFSVGLAAYWKSEFFMIDGFYQESYCPGKKLYQK